MDKYLLSIFGSSVDYFYESDTYPQEGDFSHARQKAISAGGCPFNAAAVCAAKGVKVYGLDMLGTDDDSTPFLLQEMERYKIDTSFVFKEKGVTNGKVVIIVHEDKRTMFVIDPIRKHYVIDDRLQDLLNNAGYIYSLMHMIERSFADIGPLLEAKRHGAKVILDGSSKYEDPSRTKILYSLADGLFINEVDFERLRAASPADPRSIILSGGGFVIITRGSKGATLYLKDKELDMAPPKVEVSDSTGAGDAFAGCFLACLLKGYDHETALRYASLNGAYACTRFGGTGGVASFEELDEYFKEREK